MSFIKWMRKQREPFFYILLMMVLGIGITVNITAGVFVAVLFLFIFSKINGVEASLFLLAIILLTLINSFVFHNSSLESFQDEERVFFGRIKHVIKNEQERKKYIISIKAIKDANLNKRISEDIILNYMGEEEFLPGGELIFKAKLREPMENTNPKLFNHKRYLAARDIYYFSSIKEGDVIQYVNNNGIIYRFKNGFYNRINTIFDLGLEKSQSNIIKGILLGQHNNLEEKDIDAFRKLGIAHVLAVSGLHIGILALFLLYILTLIGLNRKYAMILLMIIIWTYAFLLNWPFSIIRANIMATIMMFAFILEEPYCSKNALYFSAIVILILFPMAIFDIGFQISFLASFGILMFYKKIDSYLHLRFGRISKLISAMLAAQIAIIPLLAYYFNYLPLLGIIANIVLLPLFALILKIAITSFFLGAISLKLALVINWILNILIESNNFLMSNILKFPLIGIRVKSPGFEWTFIYYIMIFIIFGFIDLSKLDKYMKRFIIAIITMSMVLTFAQTVTDDAVTVEMIDVGQGDSILIRNKRKNILVDTGGDIFKRVDVAKNILIPYLEKHGVFSLDALIITHFDEDHCSGIIKLTEDLDVKKYIISYRDDGNRYYDYMLGANIPIEVFRKGDRFDIDDNMSAIVLAPGELDGRGNYPNDKSLVFLMKSHDKSILFTGDMELNEEQSLKGLFKGNIDIFKSPHHGSKTSSSEELLRQIKPKIAMISAGRNNMYSHPSKEVLERYKEFGIDTYRTDTMGRIKITIKSDEMAIETHIKNQDIRKHFNYYSNILIYWTLFIILSIIFTNKARKIEERSYGL